MTAPELVEQLHTQAAADDAAWMTAALRRAR